MTRSPIARLLIVDDENSLVTALCRILQAQGYRTVGANSGPEALEALRAAAADSATRFDVLITDLKMPVMDGIALVRAAHAFDAALVSIVMTGHGTIDTAVEAMKGGALDYILKPFNLSIAAPVLARALAVRALRLDNAELLVKVASRTADLEQANRELLAANKEIDAFAHSVSHDIRQPLNHIIGFADILSKEFAGPLNAKQKEYLSYIDGGGKNLLRLIEDLLNFSRFGQQVLEKRTVNMQDLVWDILRSMQTAATAATELAVGPLPDACGDASLLRQVLVNLLSNAFKFTRDVPHPRIEVTGRQGDGDATFCVRDNGAGFDMARADQLFTIFHRLHSQGDFEGTGVGLSIVQRIVERHGGSVSAEAAIGTGAAFTFTLPAQNDAATDPSHIISNCHRLPTAPPRAAP